MEPTPGARRAGGPGSGSGVPRSAAVTVVVMLVVGGLFVGAATGRSTASAPTLARSAAGPAPVPIAPTSYASGLYAHRFWDVRLPAATSEGPRASDSYVSGAAWLAYAPWDESLFVAADPATVDVVTPNSTYSFDYTVQATIGVGSSPFGVAVDPTTKQVFVTNSGSDNVTIISGTSLTTTGSLTVQGTPQGIAFDTTDATLFVANNASGTVSVFHLNATPYKEVNLTVGRNPVGVAWDARSDLVFVADSGSDAVSVLDGDNGTLVATVGVGGHPDGIAVDNTTRRVYVTNRATSNVSVLTDGSTGGIALNATIPVVGTVGLQGVAYDPEDRTIWVAAGYDDTVMINGTTQTVAGYLWVDPEGAAYDPANGDVCLTNSVNSTFTCTAFLSQASIAPLTFAETGLPAGPIGWSVTLLSTSEYIENVTQAATSASITFELECIYGCGGTYAFVVVGSDGYVPSLPEGNVSIGEQGVTVNISFAPPGPSYPVRFAATGLPDGTSWSIDLGGSTAGSTAGSLEFEEPNGTYAFLVLPVPGERADPSSGDLTVAGAAVTVDIVFAPAPSYTVTFVASGLPNGTLWNVSFNGSSHASDGRSIDFASTSGTFPYVVGPVDGYSSTPSRGTLTVTGNLTIGIDFRSRGPELFNVTFTEGDLADGTNWTVDVGVEVAWTTGDVIGFELPNGSYAYRVSTSGEATPRPADGNLTVAGEDVALVIDFTAVGVAGPLTLTSFQAIPFEIGLGATSTLVAQTSGGVAPLAYSYSGVPLGCGFPDAPIWNCTPAEPGTYGIGVEVTDAAGTTVNGTATLIVVESSPVTAFDSTSVPLLLAGGLLLVGAMLAFLAAAIVASRRPGRPPGPLG